MKNIVIRVAFVGLSCSLLYGSDIPHITVESPRGTVQAVALPTELPVAVPQVVQFLVQRFTPDIFQGITMRQSIDLGAVPHFERDHRHMIEFFKSVIALHVHPLVQKRNLSCGKAEFQGILPRDLFNSTFYNGIDVQHRTPAVIYFSLGGDSRQVMHDALRRSGMGDRSVAIDQVACSVGTSPLVHFLVEGKMHGIHGINLPAPH